MKERWIAIAFITMLLIILTIKQTPTENREKADDRLDIEYKYILDILKKEK